MIWSSESFALITQKMDLAFDVQKMTIFMLMIIVSHLPGMSGLIIADTNGTSCDGSRANITFSVDLENGTISSGSEAWYYEATVIATKPGGVFTPQTNYTGRLHTYSTYGIALDSVTAADAGRYLFFFSYRTTSPQGFKTATATLTVKVTPSEKCMPSYKQSGNLAICELDPAENCGSPRLEPMWTHTSENSFTVGKKPKEYTCCASGSILTDCYRGNSTFCKTFIVPDIGSNVQCQLVLGLSLGLGLGIQCAIIIINVLIFKCTGYKYAYVPGLILGLGMCITFIVGCIIIASLIATDFITSCKLEHGLGLGLGSGMPVFIADIIAVVVLIRSVTLFSDITNIDKFGRGIRTGLLITFVIRILKNKQKRTSKKHKDNPPKPNDAEPKPKKGQNPEDVPLDQTDNKSKTKNSGPPAVHIGTQNKVDPNSSSKQTNDRQLPLPPAHTGFEDTPTIRKLPPPPQNGEIKDRNMRGISATFGDTSDLASDTPRPKRLRPLSPKQATVQQEDASEEPKKKGNKKKKKTKKNKETPEYENAETFQRDN